MIRKTTMMLMASALTGALLNAAEVDVKIVNMTGGSYFTPLLVATHATSTTLFQTGEAAGEALQAMAEGGDISMLAADLNATGAAMTLNPAGGLLAPGKSTMTTLNSSTTNAALSLVAMILPTNDGFVALNGWKIPTEPGTYTLHALAYDAGTEANDEIVNGAGTPGAPGVPADPGGHAGSGATGVSTTAEGFVHVHRGILGDTDATGGMSDLDSTQHRWLNPVATVVVTVK